MLLVSAPHGGALWDRVWSDGQYVHGSEPSNSWFLSDAASGVMALALSAILVPVNGRRLAALATPGRAQNRQKAGAGRWGGALRAVTPSAAGLSSARPVALPGRWRAEAPAGGEDERKRQHIRPEANPQPPAPAASQRNTRPPPRGETAGCAFFPAGIVLVLKDMIFLFKKKYLIKKNAAACATPSFLRQKCANQYLKKKAS